MQIAVVEVGLRVCDTGITTSCLVSRMNRECLCNWRRVQPNMSMVGIVWMRVAAGEVGFRLRDTHILLQYTSY